jgi:Tfp pilus assembly protein PilO
MKLKLDLHRHHKMFLAGALLCTAGAGTGSWFIWKQCNDLEDQAQALAEQVTAAKQRIAGIDDLEDQVIVLRENVENYVQVLPSEAEVNEFYRKLEDFRKFAGVTILDLKPQPQRTKLTSSAVFDRAEYRMKFTGTYAQFLQFISRLENYQRFVSISEVKIAAADRDRRDKSDAEPVHSVDLTLVTYVYLGDDVGKGVSIPAYELKKEKLADQIQDANRQLALERFQLLSASGRRDPFVDPRMRGKAGAGQGIEDQRGLLNKVIARIEECNKLLELMNTANSVIREMEYKVQAINMVAEIQTQVDDVGARGGLGDAQVKREWDKRVLPELAKLRSRIGEDDTNATTTSTARLRMKQALVAMEQHYESGDYAGCVKDFELVKSLQIADIADPEMIRDQSRMEDLYRAAQTAVEFARKKLVVSGLVVEPGAESVAIINHTVYRAGDALEDDLILTEIHEDHLKFEFKGVALVYDL